MKIVYAFGIGAVLIFASWYAFVCTKNSCNSFDWQRAFGDKTTSTAAVIARTTSTAVDSKPDPIEGNQDLLISGIQGAAKIGPTCPVVRIGDASCDDKPYAGNFKIFDDHNNFVKEMVSRADGTFSAILLPGRYVIVLDSTAPMPHIQPQNVDVKKDELTKVDLNLDSGIR